MPELVQEYMVSEFRGNFPDIPVAPGVDLAELKALDPDPVFVTLPVIPKVGMVSKNGLLYDDALVQSVEQQINNKRPGGIFGHLKDTDRNTAFPIPEGMWLGAKREGEQLWAKAYIPPGAARDHIKRLKAVGGQISTSIYGKGDYEPTKQAGVRRLTNFDLESLDFAPPQRAALGHGAVPIVTSEMEQENPEMDKQQIIAELTASDIPAALREQIVAEYKTQVTDRDTVIATLKEQVVEYQRQKLDAAIDAKVVELTAWQVTGDAAKAKLEAFRRTLRSRLVAELAALRQAQGTAAEPAEAKLADVAETVWADLQPLAETVRDALAGPPALVGSKTPRSQQWRDDLVSKAGELRAQYGI